MKTNLKVSKNFRTNIAKLIAELFTYISIKKSAEKYYQAYANKEKTKDILFHAHPIQILSLLKFFGCDNEKSALESFTLGYAGSSEIPNQFMEIKTGEGKSILLGMASLIYALLGNQVSCICYSSYLSKRDYDSFQEIFNEF